MLKNGAAIVNHISAKYGENRPKKARVGFRFADRRDFVKKFTHRILTFR
jgi:hypothetical protein